MSIKESIRDLLGRTPKTVDEVRESQMVEEVAGLFMQVLGRLSLPSSNSPYKYEAHRLKRHIEKGTVSVLGRIDQSGADSVFELQEFDCERGGHTNLAVVINVRRIEGINNQDLIRVAEVLVTQYKESRQKLGSEGLKGSFIHDPCDGELKHFVQETGIYWANVRVDKSLNFF